MEGGLTGRGIIASILGLRGVGDRFAASARARGELRRVVVARPLLPIPRRNSGTIRVECR